MVITTDGKAVLPFRSMELPYAAGYVSANGKAVHVYQEKKAASDGSALYGLIDSTGKQVTPCRISVSLQMARFWMLLETGEIGWHMGFS